MVIFYHRLMQLLLGWGTVGILYSLSQLTPITPNLLYESRWDAAIAFNPDAIIWYLSFFVLIPAAYLCVRLEQLIDLRRAMQLAGFICALVFITYPTLVASQPAIVISNTSTQILEFVRQFDTGKNCLPSLHAALTLIAVWAIYHGSGFVQLFRRLIVVIWGCLILYSIIQVRRHLFIDVGAGLVVGVISLVISSYFSQKSA